MADKATTGMVTPNSATRDESISNEGEDTANTDAEVKIPAEFQKSVDSLVYSATKPQLEYVRSCVMDREKELMKGESKEEKGGTFDMENAPEI